MATRASKKPDFYDELMTVLSEVNATRSTPISYRSAVVDGMGLRDSYTGKLKSGEYYPTKERIERLAQLLGVPPFRFKAYAHRLLQERMEDSYFVELGELLAPLDPASYEILANGIVSFARKSLSDAVKPGR